MKSNGYFETLFMQASIKQFNYVCHETSKMDFCWKHSTLCILKTSVCSYSSYYSALVCFLELTTSFCLCLSRFTLYMFQKFCFSGYCIPHSFAQKNRINELAIMKLYVTLVLLMKGSCTWNITEPQGGYRAVAESYIL